MARIIVSHDGTVEQDVELTRPRMTIGRHPGNDIVIAHRAVSGQHAAITMSASDTQVEDLGSTNGTFVNGQRIARRTLMDRDVIKVALHTITYVASPIAPTAAPVAAIEVMSGPNVGKKLTLVKPLTTLGSPGVLVVVIGKQEERYFIRQVDGAGAALVNGVAVEGERFLKDGDSIDLAGTRMKFSVTA